MDKMIRIILNTAEVEEGNELIIPQMSFDYISNSELSRGRFSITKLEELLESSASSCWATRDDEIGSGMNFDSVSNGLSKDFNIVVRHSIRIGQNNGDLLRDCDLFHERLQSEAWRKLHETKERTWSICKLGSGEITVRALKSTRFPLKFPRNRPCFPFNRWQNPRIGFWPCSVSYLSAAKRNWVKKSTNNDGWNSWKFWINISSDSERKEIPLFLLWTYKSESKQLARERRWKNEPSNFE